MYRVIKNRKEDDEVLDNLKNKIHKLGSEAFPSSNKPKLIKGELKQEFMDDFKHLNVMGIIVVCMAQYFLNLHTK